MRKSRFYYSTPWYKANVIILPDLNGDYELIPNGKIQPQSRITVCGSLDTETQILSFGVAVCSKDDQFVKKIGREIAETRAIECPLVKISADNKDEISKIFIETSAALIDLVSGMKNLVLEGKL